MSVMIGLLFMSGGAYAETLTCAGATLTLDSCDGGEVNIDCNGQSSCTVAAKYELTKDSCVVQRVGTCDVTVVGASSASPAFSVSTGGSKTATLTLLDIQPQCGTSSFIFVEPKETAGTTTITLERIGVTTACAKKGPLLTTLIEKGTPTIDVFITDSVLTGWTSEGWDSSDNGTTNEGGLISLDNTSLTLTGSLLADNTLSTSSTQTGGGFISAAGEKSVLKLKNNLFVQRKAVTQDQQGTILRLALGAKATIEHNVFIDEEGVTVSYAPLINVAGDSPVTLSHNLFYGVASTLPIGTLDETIPTLKHNLFLGLTTPWQIEGVYSTGTDVFDPLGENNWGQDGVINDVGGPLKLGELGLVTLSTLWADLYPALPMPTTRFDGLYGGINLTALAIWPDSCSPLLSEATLPGPLGGGGGAWVDVLDVTTAYNVIWYCSDNVLEDDGTLCFEESSDYCADRALGETCRTTAPVGDDLCKPVDTDADTDADADTDTDSDSDSDSDKQLAGSQRTTFMKVFPLYCSASPHPGAAALPLLAALALALRRRR
ncbi:hypothetical protein L6R49_19965 [Myxococcota bacterium]|nr:hypothetical protein [Myxococcota bacterium]